MDFCSLSPELTMTNIEDASIFFHVCSEILDNYIYNLRYISSLGLIRQIMLECVDKDDILIFFTAENGVAFRLFFNGFLFSFRHDTSKLCLSETGSGGFLHSKVASIAIGHILLLASLYLRSSFNI